MLWLTKLALKRRSLVLMLSAVVVIVGLVSANALKQELFPSITFPVVSITTIYPGASSEVMDQEVTALVEKSVSGLPGVEAVSSTSSESFAFTVISFDVNVDVKEAKANVQDKINALKLPEGAQTPTLGTFDFSSLPVMVASVSGQNLAEVQARVENDLLPALSSIPGVSNISLTGGEQAKVIVTLDPEKLRANNLTQAQVVQFLQANNLSFPVGTLEDNGRSLPLRVTHQYSSTAEIEQIVVGIKGVNLGGGAGLGGGQPSLGGGLTPPAQPPAAQPTATAQVVSPTTTISPATSLIPPAMQAAGITSPAQITPQVIAQIPEQGLAQITLPLAMALTPESQAALAQRLPAPEIDPQLKAFGINTPADITPELLARFPAERAAEIPVNLALAMPPASKAALAQALATAAPQATPGTGAPAATPAAGTLPAEFAAFGITDPAQITPELIAQVPAQYLQAFTPEVIALLPKESQDALAQRLQGGEEPGAGGVPDALLIRLSDVGTVAVGSVGGATITRTNGEPSLGIEISKDPDANTIEIVEAAQAEFDRVANEPGKTPLQIKVVREQAKAIKESISGVTGEGLIGAVVAVIVIFLFLFSLRSTLVTAVSIPLSVVVALLLVRLQGFSLNVMTLGGLTVAVGRVVDDSIVVLENIYRHMRRGDKRMVAVIEGTREVASAITSSTITTVCVFLPLGVVGGIVSKFFLPFALTVTYALLASLLVALTVVPLLASIFLHPKAEQEEHDSWMQKLYTPSLRWALAHRWTTLLLALLLLGGSLALAGQLKITFLPDTSEKNIAISLSTPPGTDLQTTDARIREVEAVVKEYQARGQVRDVQTVVGRSGDPNTSRQQGGAGSSNRGQLTLTLGADVADPVALASELEGRVKQVQGFESATVRTTSADGGGPGNAGLDIVLVSADTAKLRQANDMIMERLGGTKASERFAATNITSNLAAVKPELQVQVDPQKAIKSGTSAGQIALQIRSLLNGERAGSVTLDGGDRPLELYVQVDPTALDAAKLAELPVGTVNPVPLSEVATITEMPGATSITRINGNRSATISGQFTNDDTIKTQQLIEEEIRAMGLPAGVEIKAGAQAQSQKDTLTDMGSALLVAILLVYIVMVLTFGSLLTPFVILFSLPLAVIGAVLGLYLTSKPLGITTLIGVLMLIGIVVTNAIVLLELVEQYRERGMSTYDALIEAGRVRLRPILMTAIATMVALVPLAIGLKKGGFIAADLAVVVIGGLFTSTFLTLVVVPVVYSLLDGLKQRLGFRPTHAPREHDDEGGHADELALSS